MSYDWLDGEARKPRVPADSDIAAALSALAEDPMDTSWFDTIDAALESGDRGEQYAAFRCLEHLVDHAPDAAKQRLDDHEELFDEGVHLLQAMLDVETRYTEVVEDTAADVRTVSRLLDLAPTVSVRRHGMVTLSYNIADNPMAFPTVESDLRDSLVSAYPSVQAPALRALRAYLETDGASRDGGDFLGEVLSALSTDDEEVRVEALETVATIALSDPEQSRHAADPVVDRLDSDSEAVLEAALDALGALGVYNVDTVVDAIPTCQRLQLADALDEELRVSAGMTIATLVAADDGYATLDPALAVAALDEEGSRNLEESAAIQVHWAAQHDPEPVADAVPTLRDRIRTDLRSRDATRWGTASALGSLAPVAPETVRETVAAVVEALDDPDADRRCLVTELAYLAFGAPETVAESLGVAGATTWPDDDLDGGVGAVTDVCRAMLVGVAPGYADPGTDRAAAMARNVIQGAPPDGEDPGPDGTALCRLAAAEPALVEPHAAEILEKGFERVLLLRRRYLETLVELGAEEQLAVLEDHPDTVVQSVLAGTDEG